jgi:hypothetical protein
MKCKYIKREGDSCSLNNNCKYPACTKDYMMTMDEVEVYVNVCFEAKRRGLPLIFPHDYYEEFILKTKDV